MIVVSKRNILLPGPNGEKFQMPQIGRASCRERVFILV